jgi:catechol 2,3-dioxygenase-like lactoylglutathione lyase family enzyme
MASKSTKEPWEIDAADFGKSLTGLGVNLLVSDVENTVRFSEEVLAARVVYWNQDFAVLRNDEAQWMLHADHTYDNHPLLGFVMGQEGRGQGVELQLFNQDPDAAEARAHDNDYIVLAGSADKPHGLRECCILDPDGYCWVLSRPLAD